MKTNILILLAIIILNINNLKAQTHRSEILKSVSHYTINNGNLQSIDTIEMRINERMGDNDATIYTFYSKRDKVEILYAQVEYMWGNVVKKLNNRDFSTKNYISNISMYQDDFIKYAEVRHNNYPYFVKYAIKKTVPKFYSITNKHFDSKIPLKNGKVIVEMPIQYNII